MDELKSRFSFQHALLIFLLTIAGGLGTLWLISDHNKRKYQDSAFWIKHTQTVIEQAFLVASLSKDLQLESESFLLNGDTTAQTAYTHTSQALGTTGEFLENLSLDNPEQERRAQGLNAVLHQFIQFLDGAVHQKKGKIFTREDLWVYALRCANFRKIMNRQIEVIRNEEMSLLKEKQAAN